MEVRLHLIHLILIPTVQQWIYFSKQTTITLPVAFPNNAFAAVATHLGTANTTAVIIKDLSKNQITIDVSTGSAPYGWVITTGH